MNALGTAYFYVCAALALFGAIVTVSNKNPIRGAMGLLVAILAIAGLFLALHAQFLAAIQLIVYAGAIVVLFLFVIMLLGPSAVGPRDKRGLYVRAFSGSLFGLASVAAIFLILRGGRLAVLQYVDPSFGGVDSFGRVLFSDGLVPFELASALLMVAVIGAVAVARGPGKKGLTAKEIAETPSPAGSLTADLPIGQVRTATAIGGHSGVFSHAPHEADKGHKA
jgi:NADH-quinone oxidoreductase subunit J